MYLTLSLRKKRLRRSRKARLASLTGSTTWPPQPGLLISFSLEIIIMLPFFCFHVMCNFSCLHDCDLSIRLPEKDDADDEVIMLGDSEDEDDDDDDDVIVGNISQEDNVVKEDEDNEDLDELGDEIDAACPGGESKASPHKRASSPLNRGKKKSLESDRSRSSSIEIISDTTSKDRSGSAKRKKKTGNDLKSGRQLREETQRSWTGPGSQADDPVEKYFSKEARDRGGFKVVVKNFAQDLTKSEFYSIFVRRGEVVYCEMKKDVGYVTFKTRVAAANAVRTLNGSKTDADEGKTLSVKETGSPPTRRASPDRRPYDARDRLSTSRWGPDPLADARSKLSRPRDDRNNLFSKMATGGRGGGGGYNDGRGRRHSGGSGFSPFPAPAPPPRYCFQASRFTITSI